MKEYHKIQTVFKRNPNTNYKTLLFGKFSLPEFEYLATNKWIFTEKVDGTNIRVMFVGEQITFGGKTDNAQIPGFLLQKLNSTFLPKLEKFKERFSEGNVCFYGEGYGAKIQKSGGNYRPDQDFVLFDIKIGNWWLRREQIEEIAKDFELNIVPIVALGTLYEMIEIVKNGFYSSCGTSGKTFLAEGIVARPEIELFSRNEGRIITKIKHSDFTS